MTPGVCVGGDHPESGGVKERAENVEPETYFEDWAAKRQSRYNSS